MKLRTVGLLLLMFGFCGSGNALDSLFPDIIPLPDGFRPEGVARGIGSELFAGSLADGSVYSADLRTGQIEPVIPPQDGRIAVGLSFDQRSGLLFVAGGPAGKAYVYDSITGNSVAEYQLSSSGSFVNDVFVTRGAAYFTDSFQPVLYRLPLDPGGKLSDSAVVETIPLGGDFVFITGAFNTNGIVSSAAGDWLIIVHSTLGTLYLVDPETGVATLIDLGGADVVNGDGLVLEGRSLYVVQNRLNQVAVVELSPDFTSGDIVDIIIDDAFDVPTTAAIFGKSLYAVNARFGTPPQPDTEYEIVAVPK